MRAIQFLDEQGQRAIAVIADDAAGYHRVEAATVRDLALDAYRRRRLLAKEIESRMTDRPVDVDQLLAERRILVPLDHPDPAHMVLAVTGLTHLGSARQRDVMHAKLRSDDLSDSMKMFKMGLEGGKPSEGAVGVQPEWAYKGDGDWLVPPEGVITRPGFAQGGGEEAEVCGLYVIADDGTPLRVGFALGNEYSDHVMERRNYLYLAHSKLRQSGFGPEMLIGELPSHVEGSVVLWRGEKTLWRSRFLSGEANMTHTIGNLEEHHFKYAGFRRPGDVHVYYFGASALSFGDGVDIAAGDMLEITCPVFGKPLRQKFAAGTPVRFQAVPL